MTHYHTRAMFVVIASLCAIGGSTFKAQAQSVHQEASGLGKSVEISLLSNPEPMEDSSVRTYSSQTVDGYEPIARLDIQKLCESFPLNSRCQGLETPKAQETPAETPKEPVSPETTTEKKGTSSGFAITPNIGTLGIGLQVTKRINSHFNARLGGSFFEYKVNDTSDDVKYDAKLRMLNVTAAGDYYPWKKSGFHVSLGLAVNGNKVSGSANSTTGTIDINDVTYNAADVGSLKAKISYPSPVAPYIGIGWGNPVGKNKRFSFYANAGVLITGSPKASFSADLNPTLPQATQDQIREDLKAEEQSLQKSLNNFPVYPVVSVGFSYQF